MTPASISGTVTTGQGKAAGFTNIDWVQRGLLERVGITPWPGTLNLQLAGSSDRDTLMQRPGCIDLPGQNGACAAKLLPVTVGTDASFGIPASVVVPVVDDYADTALELVAPVALREALAVNDGSNVVVTAADSLEIDAAIFDLDGTLVDSLEAYYQVAKEAAASHDRAITRDFVRGTLDANNHSFWELVFTEDVPNRHDLITDVKFKARERWPEIQHQYLAGLPGISNMIRTLHGRGTKLGIVTAGSGSTMQPLIDEGVHDLFGAIVTKKDVDAPKPDPQGLRLALEQLGVDAEGAVYVGDSRVDIRTARAAKVRGVAVLSGAGTDHTLAVEGPVRMLRSVADFQSLL